MIITVYGKHGHIVLLISFNIIIIADTKGGKKISPESVSSEKQRLLDKQRTVSHGAEGKDTSNRTNRTEYAWKEKVRKLKNEERIYTGTLFTAKRQPSMTKNEI